MMDAAVKDEVLTGADATWFHAETRTNHFVVTALALLDQPLDALRFRKMLSRRIGLHPRLLQVVSEPNIPLMPLYWTRAKDFDLDAHLHKAALPWPSGKAELQDMLSDLAGLPLDYGRPLWECHLVEGPGSGGALITRFHHALGDGHAMIRMLRTMTDPTPSGWRRAVHRSRPKRSGDLDRIVHTAGTLAAGVIHAPQLALKGVEAVGTLARLTLMDPDPPTPLRGHIGLVKRLSWSEPISLNDVKRIARLLGATVNDVLVSCVAGALGDHLRHGGTETHGLRIRAMVPIDLRPADDDRTSGNGFSLVYLELPMGITRPIERLMRVKGEMDRIKLSAEPAVGLLMASSLGLLPASLEHVAAKFYADKASLVLTNVVGPKDRIYIAGAPVSLMTFWEPESGGLGLGISIHSYAGEVTVGVIADRNLLPEPTRITAGFERAFHELAMVIDRPK